MAFAATFALLTIAAALIFGFYRGFTRMIPVLIGTLVGILCAHIFMAPLQQIILDFIPISTGKTESRFILSNLAAYSAFIIAFLIFYLATYIISLAFKKWESTVADGISGALLSLFTSLIFLSIIFNTWVCFQPHSLLMKSMRHSDGNIVHSVMMVAPSLLGAQTPEELSLLQQLDEAKAIS